MARNSIWCSRRANHFCSVRVYVCLYSRPSFMSCHSTTLCFFLFIRAKNRVGFFSHFVCFVLLLSFGSAGRFDMHTGHIAYRPTGLSMLLFSLPFLLMSIQIVLQASPQTSALSIVHMFINKISSTNLPFVAAVCVLAAISGSLMLGSPAVCCVVRH